MYFRIDRPVTVGRCGPGAVFGAPSLGAAPRGGAERAGDAGHGGPPRAGSSSPPGVPARCVSGAKIRVIEVRARVFEPPLLYNDTDVFP